MQIAIDRIGHMRYGMEKFDLLLIMNFERAKTKNDQVQNLKGQNYRTTE